MELTGQTVNVSLIRYRLEWHNTPTSDQGGGSITVQPGEGPNFLDLADEFALDWAADVMGGIVHTSYSVVRAFLGSFETTETTIS